MSLPIPITPLATATRKGLLSAGDFSWLAGVKGDVVAHGVIVYNDDARLAAIAAHTGSTANPHQVTLAQVGGATAGHTHSSFDAVTFTAAPVLQAGASVDADGRTALGHPGFADGRYYVGGVMSQSATTYYPAARLMVPIFAASSFAVDRIGIEVTTASGTAGCTFRLGIYRCLNGRPTTLVVDAGTVLVDSLGIKEATINVTLLPGWYFLVVWTGTPDGAATRGAVYGLIFDFLGSELPSKIAVGFNCWGQDAAYGGVFPEDVSAVAMNQYNQYAPLIWLRKT